MPKLGEIVFFKEVIKDGETTSPIFPAIIFKLYPKEFDYVGLYVFKEVGITKFGKIPRGVLEETWNYHEEDFDGSL